MSFSKADSESFFLKVSSDCLWSFSSTASVAARSYSHGKQETDEEFDARWVTYFNKPDIDAWELRKGGLRQPFDLVIESAAVHSTTELVK